MDGARNLLLGTCKERNLRNKDENVEDENHTFLSIDLESQGISNHTEVKQWSDTTGSLTLSGIDGELPHRQSNVLRFGSPVTEITTPSWLELKDNPIFNLVDTGELYLRIKTHWDGTVYRPSGELSVMNLISDFGTHFDFSFVIDRMSSGKRAFIRLNWKDKNGDVGSYTSPTTLFSNNTLEIKLFFYADHIHISAIQGGVNQGETIIHDIPFGGLPRDKGATFTIGRNRTNNSQYRGYVNRLGFGRSIDSRPPVPTF